MTQTLFIVILVIALLSAMIGAYFFYRVNRWHQGRVVRTRFEKGVEAEEGVEAILARYGFELVEAQPRVYLKAQIDGQDCEYLVRPDGIARQGEQLFWVEMKSGKKATKPLSTQTRRQLLEYSLGSGGQPVLFIDAEEKSLRKITFGGSCEHSSAARWQIKEGKRAVDVSSTS